MIINLPSSLPAASTSLMAAVSGENCGWTAGGGGAVADEGES
jgi:hypothetical protein